jgi:hypothetical protein
MSFINLEAQDDGSRDQKQEKCKNNGVQNRDSKREKQNIMSFSLVSVTKKIAIP